MNCDVSLLSNDDLFLFNEGAHYRLYEKLGAHPTTVDGVWGTYFAVWAPNAKQVFVMGEFNGWDKSSHPLCPKGQSGIWEGFIPGVAKATIYKYYIASHHRGYCVEKADPFAFYAETPPKTASIVWDFNYNWGDQAWMEKRHAHNALDAPISIYEVHLGSWRRVPEEGNADLTVGVLSVPLPEAANQLGVLVADAEARVRQFQEKPAWPAPSPDDPLACLASMGIYVFRPEALARRLEEDSRISSSSHDFGKDVINRMVGEDKVVAFSFECGNRNDTPYWRDVGTVDAYWDAHMDLVAMV